MKRISSQSMISKNLKCKANCMWKYEASTPIGSSPNLNQYHMKAKSGLDPFSDPYSTLECLHCILLSNSGF